MHGIGAVLGASTAFLFATFTTTVLAAAGGGNLGSGKDPIEAEIERLASYVRENPSQEETWSQIRQMSEPVLTRAADAAHGGYRWLALSRLAAAYGNIEAFVFMGEHSSEQLQDTTAFRNEWIRLGDVLRDDLGPISPGELADVRPAAVRAVGEAALPQPKVYYEASPDFERATDPTSGFFYLGLARAQRDLTRFCRGLSESGLPASPPLRSLDSELDALEGEVLKAYRPPASVDRHSEFILVGSSLKEARELNALGLRHGALLRYLQAAYRSAPLADRADSMTIGELESRLEMWESRLAAPGVDHSIGALFVELARLELAHADSAGSPSRPAPTTAVSVVDDVLPRYLAALDPAAPPAARPEPKVTVTLVRWPYT